MSSWHYLNLKKKEKEKENLKKFKNLKKRERESLNLLLLDWGNKSLTMKGKFFYLFPKAANPQSKALPGAFLEATSAPWVTSLTLLEPGRAVRVPSTSEP